MRSIVYMGPKNIEIRERPMPVIKLGEALIKVKYCGICGSDPKIKEVGKNNIKVISTI